MRLPIGKIICGDCVEVLKRQIPSESIDLVVTSPPYNLGIKYDIYDDNLPYEEYLEWCKKWLKELYRVLKVDGRLCLVHYLSCGTATFRFAPLMDINSMAQQIGFRHHAVAIWWDITIVRRTAWGSWISASAPYVNCPFEGVLVLYKDKWKKLEQKRKTCISKVEFMEACSGIWKIPTEKQHRTTANFPIELPSRCIRLFSVQNDVLLDPFVGSGTTCVAAEQLGRRWIGIEISKKYCEVAEMRIDYARRNPGFGIFK